MIKLLLGLVLAVSAVAAASDEFTSENVVIGDPSSFETSVANSHALVLLYAPWCGHCKSIKPAWNKLADLFEDVDDVKVVAVDADKHRSLGERFGVQGFPTLKYLPKGGGEPEAYEGGRSEADMMTFLNGKAGTDVSADGGVGKSGGVLPELGEVLAGFGEASNEEKEEKLEKLRDMREGLEEDDEKKASAFAMYAKVGAKIMKHGMEYVAKEKERLGAMLTKSKGSLSSDQRKNFQRRINVLTVFDEL